MYYYAFTLRKLSGTNFQKCFDVESHIQQLREKYKHLQIEYHFEYTLKANGKHNIHIHGMISTPKKVLYKMIHPGPGYKLDIDVCKSIRAWTVYMTKQNIVSAEACLDNIQAEGELADPEQAPVSEPSEASDTEPDETPTHLFKQRIV